VAGTDAGAVVVETSAAARGRIGHRGAVTCVTAGEGCFASGGVDGRARVWDLDLEPLVEDLHPAPVVAVALVDDLVVSADAAGGMTWSGARHRAHEGAVSALVVSDEAILSAGLDGVVKRWSRSGEPEGEIARSAYPIDTLAATDGQVAYADAEGWVVIGDRRWQLGRRDVAVHALAFTSVGLVAATTDGFLHRLGDGTRWSLGRGAFPVVFHDDLAIFGVEGGLRALRLGDGAFVGAYAPVGGSGISVPDAIALRGGDEPTLISAHQGLDLWPLEPLGPVDAHVGYVASISWVDGHLVTAGNDGAVALRDPQTLAGRCWPAHGSRCQAVAPGPDGVIATGSRDDIALWDRQGREIGRWRVPGCALAWHPDGRLLFGGERVRLGWLRPGETKTTVVAEARNAFQLQTHQLSIGSDGRVLARARSGTEGEWIALDDGTRQPIALDAAASASPRLELATGQVVVASKEGDLGFDEPPPLRDVPTSRAEQLEGDAPPLPGSIRPSWLREWLDQATARTYARRPELVAGLSNDPGGVPHERALAWACSIGAGESHHTQFGLRMFQVRKPAAEGRTLVAWAWPRHYEADEEGCVFVDDLRQTRRRGDLDGLLLSLALDSAMAAGGATLHLSSAQAPSLAEALALDPLDGVAGWWGDAQSRLDAGDGEARLAGEIDVLAAGIAAAEGGVRLSVRGFEPKLRPLEDAPPLPEPSGQPLLLPHPEGRGHVVAIAKGKKTTIHQVMGRDGRVVREVTWTGRSAKGQHWIAVTEATPLTLSPRGRAFLARAKATRDPLHTCRPHTLRTLLEDRGLPIHPAVLDMEAALGGLSLTDPRDSESFAELGTYHLLASWPLGWTLGDQDRQAGLVPVGHLFGDEMIALDEKGRLLWQEMVAMPRMVVVADDYRTFIERWLLELAAPPNRLRIEGRHGDALAKALGLSLVGEASDTQERWWSTEDLGLVLSEPLPYNQIVNGEPEGPSTTLALPKTSLSAPVEKALTALGTTAVTSDHPRLATALRKGGWG